MQADEGVEHVFGEALNREAIVVGAGTSLEVNIPKLQRSLAKTPGPLLISVGTASRILVEANIIPDYLVIIDKDISVSHPLLSDFSKMKRTSLIYSPVVNPELIEAWLGSR